MQRGPVSTNAGQLRTARSSTVVLATTPLARVARTSTRHTDHVLPRPCDEGSSVPSMTPDLEAHDSPGGVALASAPPLPSRVHVNHNALPRDTTGSNGCMGVPGATNSMPLDAAGYISAGGAGGGVGGAGVGGGAARTLSHSCIDADPKALRAVTLYRCRFTTTAAVPPTRPVARSSTIPAGSGGITVNTVPD